MIDGYGQYQHHREDRELNKREEKQSLGFRRSREEKIASALDPHTCHLSTIRSPLCRARASSATRERYVISEAAAEGGPIYLHVDLHVDLHVGQVGAGGLTICRCDAIWRSIILAPTAPSPM